MNIAEVIGIDPAELWPSAALDGSAAESKQVLGRLLRKSTFSQLVKNFREEDHPRGKDGRFISKQDIIAAAESGDSEKIKELINQVDSKNLKKLEGALGEAGLDPSIMQAAEDAVGRGNETERLGDGEAKPNAGAEDQQQANQSRTAALRRRDDHREWESKVADLESITGKDITEFMDEMIVGGYAEQNKWLDQKINESLSGVSWDVDDPFSPEAMEQQSAGESSEEAAKRKAWSESRAKHRENFKRSLATSGLPDDKKKAYLESMQKALSVLPTKAFEKLDQSLADTMWHGSVVDLTLTMEDAGLKVVSDNYVVGVYVHDGSVKGGTLHLDGGDPAGKSDATEIYVHEMAHAFDHDDAVGRISSSQEWQEAWQSEIADGSISDYAATKASEGWAEFARHAFLGAGPESISKSHPKSAAVFRKYGLLP